MKQTNVDLLFIFFGLRGLVSSLAENCTNHYWSTVQILKNQIARPIKDYDGKRTACTCEDINGVEYYNGGGRLERRRVE